MDDKQVDLRDAIEWWKSARAQRSGIDFDRFLVNESNARIGVINEDGSCETIEARSLQVVFARSLDIAAGIPVIVSPRDQDGKSFLVHRNSALGVACLFAAAPDLLRSAVSLIDYVMEVGTNGAGKHSKDEMTRRLKNLQVSVAKANGWDDEMVVQE